MRVARRQPRLLLAAAAAALVSSLQWQLLLFAAADVAGGQQIALDNCNSSCGGVSVPYPFGIGTECSLPGFNLTCDYNSSTPQLLLGDLSFVVDEIFVNDTTVRVRSDAVVKNFSSDPEIGPWGPGDGDGSPFVLAEGRNEFILTGCAVLAELYMLSSPSPSSTTSNRTINGCASFCYTPAMVDDVESIFNGTGQGNTTAAASSGGKKKCSGIGCCQAPVPAAASLYNVTIQPLDNDTHLEFDAQVPVSVLLAEDGWFDWNVTSLETFRHKLYTSNTSVSLVLAWAINSTVAAITPGDTRNGSATCPTDLNTTTCHSDNSVCRAVTYHYTTDTAGYSCRCLDGYQGNPYLPQGCQDIDECSLPDIYKCYGICTNQPGTYACHCPRGTNGDANVQNGCQRSHPSAGLSIAMGVASFLVLLFIALATTFLVRHARAQRKKMLRQRFFDQNRGQLLQQLVCHRADIAERMIVTLEELEKATNNFDKARELGRGGHGTVYKGILSSLYVVAIKKSKIVIQREINEFINEIAILSQVNHKNIVKILGCCLETEVPLLVYEFISNGSLYNHLHVEKAISLSWKDRLRIAVEIARAITYLHSSVSMPIIHRDIKSPNILLNDNLTAKLSDFGASRYIPIDETGVETIVQGTYGYLDPMYFRTGYLTEKSDVYSFGVLLIELLTRKKPVSYRSNHGLSLVDCFVTLLSHGKLVDILDPQVDWEGDGEVVDVARLAATCVKLTSDDRPTMRNVEMALQRIYASKEYLWKHVMGDESKGARI